MQHLPKALLLALLVGTPVMAQRYAQTWDEFREALLGPNRAMLMASCAEARNFNRDNDYYFSDRWHRWRVNFYTARGVSYQTTNALLTGLAAAMAIACPEVR